MAKPVALTIAGSDSSGGAGVEADLKTMCALGVYGAAALTSVTAQNTLGVTDCLHLPESLVAAQIDAVFDDIKVDAVKTGMLATAGIIDAVAKRLRAHGVSVLVVDPVMVATSGAALIEDEAVETMKRELLPMCLLLTPNMPEASALAGLAVDSRESMVEAGRAIRELGPDAVLVKGGHLEGPAADVLCDAADELWLQEPRLSVGSLHGTGCTLSSAVASWLARGLTLRDAVARAKSYVTRCIDASMDMGRGSRLLDHRDGAKGEGR
ncbi:MAG: bifunctional hydroxymethylpyrimidine kinase/phosphomethylpyrimidine kinase [Candidatus Eisenbacteria bacterium]|nr:bifunctional hydroxymethylpyrimidine kinase/phosphomethylpyrimidine kinase [Candidatus Eisenbacteria bacterium]